MTKDGRREELRGLTIARFVAAMAVVGYHFARHFDTPPFVRNILVSGSSGVTFFFALSGFILVYTARRLPLDRRAFWVRRFARIYPVYLLAWLAFGIWQWSTWNATDVSTPYMVKAALTYGGLSLVLVQSWLPHVGEVWNGPGWTLSAEAFFYACFPFLLARLWRLTDRKLAIVFAIAIAANVAQVCLAQSSVSLLPDTAFATRLGMYMIEFPPLRISQFIAGMVVGLLFVRYGAHRPPPWVLATVLCLLVVILGNSSTTYADIWLLPAFCVTIYLLAFAQAQGKAWDGLVLLGKASYGIYILQSPIWRWLWWPEARPDRSLIQVLIYVALLIAVSTGVYLIYEAPLERWIKDRFIATRRRSSHAQSDAVA